MSTISLATDIYPQQTVPTPLPAQAQQQQQQQPQQPQAPAAAQQQPQQPQQQGVAARALTPDQLELVRRDLAALNKRVEEEFGNRTDLDDAALYAALELRGRYTDIIERSGLAFSQWPLGVNMAIGKLDAFLVKTNAELKQFLDETNKDPESNAAMTRYLNSPQEFRPIVTQVMASRNARLFSQKEAEKRIQEERAVLEKKHATELAEERDKLAKRTRELEEANTVASKRYRFDTPAVPAAPVSAINSAIATNSSSTSSVGSSLPTGAEIDDFWSTRLGASREFARSAGWLPSTDDKVRAVIEHVRHATTVASNGGAVLEGPPLAYRR